MSGAAGEAKPNRARQKVTLGLRLGLALGVALALGLGLG